jgi:glycosyltransferase involved in cell wall biosynthesis
MQAVVGQNVSTPLDANWDPLEVSIAIFAWNEERSIASTLQSLFQQSIFRRLRERGARCEIICVTNGCTDRTPLIAEQIAAESLLRHRDRDAVNFRVANIAERGKVNAWNQFVHRLSARSARVLFMMDADILIDAPDTMWNMLGTLECHSDATVAVDLPRKDLAYKKSKSFSDRLSMAASQMTQAAEGQLCGQLYCIRAGAARKIYLPKDLAACEDGYIKTLVCTDFLTQSVRPERIRLAENAGHTFDAYTSLAAILKNQKRQIIGQTIIHLLIDRYFMTLSRVEKQGLADFIKAKDSTDPTWLKQLIRGHIERTRCFWRLYPGLLANRFHRLRRLDTLQRLRCFPAAVAGCCAALAASFVAYQSLKRGCTNYWPKAKRESFERLNALESSKRLCTEQFLKKSAG